MDATGEGALASGQSVTVTLPSETTASRYDIRLEGKNGVSYEKRNLRLSNNQRIEFTNTDRVSESTTGQSAASQTESTEGTFNVGLTYQFGAVDESGELGVYIINESADGICFGGSVNISAVNHDFTDGYYTYSMLDVATMLSAIFGFSLLKWLSVYAEIGIGAVHLGDLDNQFGDMGIGWRLGGRVALKLGGLRLDVLYAHNNLIGTGFGFGIGHSASGAIWLIPEGVPHGKGSLYFSSSPKTFLFAKPGNLL